MKRSCPILLNIFPILLLGSQAFFSTSQSTSTNGSVYFRVGVILDLNSQLGRIGLSCLSLALSDFYSAHDNYTTRLVLHVRNSNGQVIDAAAAALDLLKGAEVDAIVGPQKSRQAHFVTDLADRAHVPIISLSATNPSSLPKTPFLVRTSRSYDTTLAAAIAAIVQTFQWREVVIIHEDTDSGYGMVPFFSNAFQGINARISNTTSIPLSASDDSIALKLYTTMTTTQSKVFVVHMSLSVGTRLFLKAKEIGMLREGYSWIIIDEAINQFDSSDLDSQVIEAMQGALVVRPIIPRSNKLDSFVARWKRKFLEDNPSPTIEQNGLSIFGLRAYDAMWALAMAAENVDFREPIITMHNKTMNHLTNPFSFGISQTGPRLHEAFLETRFEGLGGEFHLVNGHQFNPSSPFQIMNVIGKGAKEVGNWTQSRGISWKYNYTNPANSSPYWRENIWGIKWPGESKVVPRGWEFSRSTGEKLKIAVPTNDEFTEFVKLDINPLTGSEHFTGYGIEIFDAVMEALNYTGQYKYVSFSVSSGSCYNDLINQVHLKKYDAAVGDITITANRLMHVDFTLPFSEGGVSMVVPIKYESTRSIWTFLEPLETELWLTSIVFFILTGFSVWFMEHRINSAFRGPPSQHIGMILWFPFSTLVFAHRERIVSNLAKLVVVVWLFVVLILTSSYTASLSSRLTVQTLLPTVTTVGELIKNGDYVGYPDGSFVADALKEMGFQESKVRPLKSRPECDETLSKGSRNGGISAFFDTVPQNERFVSKHCGKYTTVGPIYQTAGFGFVFPKDSPLVADVSQAVINVMEGRKILEVKKMWLGDPTCKIPEILSAVSLNSLTLHSFIGLFAITGSVTILCLLVSVAEYTYKNRDVIRKISESSTTNWSKIRALCRHFDQRDLESYPFRSREALRQAFETTDIGSSSISCDAPSLSGNSNTNIRMVSAVDEEAEDATEIVNSNSGIAVVVQLQGQV